MRSPGVVDEVVETLSAQAGKRCANVPHEGVERAHISRIELQGDSFGSSVPDDGDHLVGFCTIRVVGKNRMDAPFGDVYHCIPAEPAAPAGNDCDLSS